MWRKVTWGKVAFVCLSFQLFSAGAFADCANFSGRWSDRVCKMGGEIVDLGEFDFLPKAFGMIQKGCEVFDFGGSIGDDMPVLETGKPISIDLDGVHAIAQVDWENAAQQALMFSLKTTLDVDDDLDLKVKPVNFVFTYNFSIQDGKLNLEFNRMLKDRPMLEGGYRCVYSKREKI